MSAGRALGAGELLPCPWCGGEASFEHLENTRWAVGCGDGPDGEYCYGFQSFTTFPTKKLAAEAWNTRTPTPDSERAGGSEAERMRVRLAAAADLERKEPEAHAFRHLAKYATDEAVLAAASPGAKAQSAGGWQQEQVEAREAIAAEIKIGDRYAIADCVLDGLHKAGLTIVRHVERDTLVDLLGSELSDSYDCTRVWSAWGYGTMGEDDFTPVADRAGDIADGILAALAQPTGEPS